MMLFKGASAETFRMKEKPIKEGYKVWAFCDATSGYVLCFTPARRTSKAVSEFHTIPGGQLNSILHFLLTFVPESAKKKMLIVMDNLFTTEAVCWTLREKKIGILGTIRARKGYPSKEFMKSGEDLIDFNKGVWDLDDGGNLVRSLTSALFSLSLSRGMFFPILTLRYSNG